jgi:hypothetical protein
MNRNKIWVRPAVVAIGAVVVFAAVAVIIVTKTAADRSASLVVALVGGLAIGVLFLIVGQPWRSPLTPRMRLMRLLNTHVRTIFGGDQMLALLWSGRMADLPEGAGGFVDFDQLLGSLGASPIYDVHVADGATLRSTPTARVTAFVYRSYLTCDPGLIFFGNKHETPTPHDPLNWTDGAYAVPMEKVGRASRLPEWAVGVADA